MNESNRRKPGSGKTRAVSAPSSAVVSTRGEPAARAVLEPVEADDGIPAHAGPLDRYDIAILSALQRDARLSNAELATRIGLSAAPTWRRVRWLETQGYITGYHATLDRRKLGLGVLAFVRVDAERNTGATTRELEDAIRQLPEVLSCHYISGAGTFELQVLVTDLEAFSTFSIKTLLDLPNVKDIHTSFSLGEVKSASGVPLGHLR